ncbi:MAG: MBL fold metallo-hydrolase [Isosphaeraceae bacterium]|nr:MBL fold metallo-hydrolase [Isosphaeraceae bacterium]
MSGVHPLVSLRLVNGSTGDPALLVDYPGRDDALLFDVGENGSLDDATLADLGAVFISHHHVDHFIGFDRVVRANLDRDKALSVYGPEGTIRKVYDKIKSYEYPFFPFQKLVIKVHDVLPGVMRSALLECTRRFPEPTIEAREWPGPVVHDTADLSVEATLVDHTTPCLAFALVEKPVVFPDPERLAQGPIRPGPWVSEALELIRRGAPSDAKIRIGAKLVALEELRATYFTESACSRIAYVTDTAWSQSARPSLLRLAHEATRLYCDAFYADAQRKSAEKHRHMTATQAAEFAREAGVSELVLIHFAARYKGHFEALVAEARAVFPNSSAEIPAGAVNKSRPRANRS